jgi:hypothetical protein
VKAILKVLIVWMILLAVPLQGFASATMSLCAPSSAAAQHDHDHESMADDADASGAHAHGEDAGPDMQTDHHPATHHHTAKCTTCSTCGSCASMVPSFIAVLPVSASPSITVPFDQGILPSVYLALPERPPRADRLHR